MRLILFLGLISRLMDPSALVCAAARFTAQIGSATRVESKAAKAVPFGFVLPVPSTFRQLFGQARFHRRDLRGKRWPLPIPPGHPIRLGVFSHTQLRGMGLTWRAPPLELG